MLAHCPLKNQQPEKNKKINYKKSVKMLRLVGRELATGARFVRRGRRRRMCILV
jgi:hypothetical protein